MPYCSFTIDEVEFGYSYGDGLVIPRSYLNPDYLFNLEFCTTLVGAFQISNGLELLLYISQYSHIPDDKEKLQKLVELKKDVVRYGVQFEDQNLAILLDTVSKEASQYLLLTGIVPKENRSGYVYLLHQIGGTYYKIGRTKNPNDRIKTFAVKLPFKVEYEALIYTVNMNELERQLHTRFKSKRVDGEWFALATDDVTYIKGLADKVQA